MSWKGFVKQLEGQLDKVLDIQPPSLQQQQQQQQVDNWGIMDWENPTSMISIQPTTTNTTITTTTTTNTTNTNTITSISDSNNNNSKEGDIKSQHEDGLSAFLTPNALKGLSAVQTNLTSMFQKIPKPSIVSLQAPETDQTPLILPEHIPLPPSPEPPKPLNDKSDDKVAALMAEGRELAETNGKLSQALKKLKQKYQEQLDAFKQLESKYVSTQNNYAQEHEKTLEMAANERKLTETIASLNEINQQLLKENQRIDQELAESKSKQNNLQNTLDRTWQEVAELRRQNVVSATNDSLAAKERESSEQLRKDYDQLRIESMQIESGLKREINELRITINRLEEESLQKDDLLKREISLFQQRLQNSELRCEDLSQNVQEVTKPLIRQIESLQQHQQSVQQTFKAVEASLNKQLQAAHSEKDELLMQVRTLTSQVSDYERQVALSRKSEEKMQKEKDLLQFDVEKEKRENRKLNELIKDFETRLSLINNEHEANKSIFESMVKQNLQAEFDQASRDLREKIGKLETMLLEKEKEIQRLQIKLSELRSTSNSPSVQTSYAMDVHLTTRISSLENQVSHLEQQLKSALDAKEKLSDDLVTITSEYNRIKSEHSTLSNVDLEFKDLQKRHEMALELLGEKTERVEELQQDIVEMKLVYRQQLEELLQQINNNDK